MEIEGLNTTITAFAEVILPLSLQINYNYGIPEELESRATVGKRVEIQFGKRKIYAGIIKRVHHEAPKEYKIKPILSILDESPIVSEKELKFWEWVSSYYMCSEGEVMNAALPAAFKLESETTITLHPSFKDSAINLPDKEYLIVEALSIHKKLKIQEVTKILQLKTVYPVVQSLIKKNVIIIKEGLIERFKPKIEIYITLHPDLTKDENLRPVFEELEKKAPKQLELLMAYIHLCHSYSSGYISILKTELLEKIKNGNAALNFLLKKEIFHQENRETGRINDPTSELTSFDLTATQQKSLDQIRTQFVDKDVVLLYGVTGSGKTNVYLRLIEEVIAAGQQVLYLLPEIALTAQIIERLRKQFGQKIGIYHSRFNQQERVEIWNKLLQKEYNIILGARSALFLPFNELGLVIVDEEHDPSYKQNDPAPRYHGRDAAIYLASLSKAKTLLGTATPSLESYYNAVSGKYGHTELNERFAGLEMPDIIIADVKEAKRKKQMHSLFTIELLDALKAALDKKEQAILFQNRRGYAPYMECENCGWVAMCPNCDVHLTYHKFQHELKCHYCGHRKNSFTQCPACGSSHLQITGFGTEKVEDELKQLLPEVAVARLDYDAVRKKFGYQKIIGEFERGKTQVLVGTQMVTKGLDFENVSLVGILNADQLINYSDFRSAERGFQLMSQVSGRAGRKHKQGKVIIQTTNISTQILPYIILHDFRGFYQEEINHRKRFDYPPFSRLIQITFKHKDKVKVWDAARLIATSLQKELGKKILGPAEPPIARIRNQYLVQCLIKLKRSALVSEKIKNLISEELKKLYEIPLYRQVVVVVDIDPY
jgi:primosomal protein N' (replication factor Y)